MSYNFYIREKEILLFFCMVKSVKSLKIHQNKEAISDDE